MLDLCLIASLNTASATCAFPFPYIMFPRLLYDLAGLTANPDLNKVSSVSQSLFLEMVFIALDIRSTARQMRENEGLHLANLLNPNASNKQ